MLNVVCRIIFHFLSGRNPERCMKFAPGSPFAPKSFEKAIPRIFVNNLFFKFEPEYPAVIEFPTFVSFVFLKILRLIQLRILRILYEYYDH